MQKLITEMRRAVWQTDMGKHLAVANISGHTKADARSLCGS